MGSEKEDVFQALRSCLLAFKNGVALAALNHDYRDLEGRNIPYRQLGFQSLEIFIQNVPGIRTMRRGGDIWVETIPNEKNAHISKLVAGQNQAKSRRRRKGGNRFPRNYQGISRSSVRPVSSSYNAPSRGYNRNISSNSQPRISAPRPLLQIPIMRPPPVNTTGNHRYMGTATNGVTSSPSKRLAERRIQPRHELDYAIRPKNVTVAPVPVKLTPAPVNLAPAPVTLAPVTVTVTPVPVTTAAPVNGKNTKKALFPDNSQITKFPQATSTLPKPFNIPNPVFPGLFGGTTETSRTLTETSILEMDTPRIPWQPPPSRIKPSEQLNVQPPPSLLNSSFANANIHSAFKNTNIQITFQNPMATNGFHTATPTITPSAEDPRLELQRIARDLRHEDPIYKITPIQGKNKNEPRFYARVEIGTDKFSSYPDEAITPIDAEILVARKALLQKKNEHYTSTSLVRTNDKEIMKSRLLKILDEHTGVFIHKLSEIYRDKFKENLPDDWKNEIEQWSEFVLEKGAEDSWILCQRIPPTPEKTHEQTLITEKVIGLRQICRAEPGTLVLPEENNWCAYVTYVGSTVDVWIRLVGENYSEKFEAMTNEMSQYYSTMKTSAKDPELNCYYAVMEDDSWHRVRVIDCDLASNEAIIFFIDIGDEDTIEFSRLYPLSHKFCTLPAQAMRASLLGLEDFADCDSVLTILEDILLGPVFFVEDFNRQIDDDTGVPKVDLILYDTSTEDDIDINDLITEDILKLMTPSLENATSITPVNVMHVDTNGDVFVQIENEGSNIVKTMLQKLMETGLTAEDRRRCVLEKVEKTSVYFVRCSETSYWYRAKFLDVEPIGKDRARRLKMYLIDEGRSILVDVSNVIQLEKLSVLLARYPAQAVKVRLDKLEKHKFDVEIIEMIKELVPSEETSYLQVVKKGTSNNPPIVEIHTTMPNNKLESLNKNIVELFELKCFDGDGNNNVKVPRKRRDRGTSRATTVDHDDSARALPAPKISDIGQYFDVHVTMAANPAHFTVQPFNTMEQLRNMMENLQEECIKSDKLSHPTLESIRERRLYAARHSDGDWYRGCVMDVINVQMVSVYFVDYGDVCVIDMKDLLPLSKQFLDLPYQAIKARLVGLKPKHGDWRPEDCARFSDLTVGQNLVSIVMEMDADRHLPRDTVLGLTLIDVSTENDIYIGEVLVNEGRAQSSD